MSIVLLEKNDFFVTSRDQLVVRHPAFKGRGGFLAIYTYWCPQCQDTKTSWSAIGMVNGNVNVNNPHVNNHMASRSKCLKRYPLLRKVHVSGLVSDYPGSDGKHILHEMCRKANMNCGNLHRCFDNKRWYQH